MEDMQPQLAAGQSRSCILFKNFCKLLFGLVVLFGIITIILFLIVLRLPHRFKFNVTKAELTQFDYDNNTLHYNMVLNFTTRNPNKEISIYYDEVEARAFYEESRFANVEVIKQYKNSFRQHKKSSDSMSGVFSGQQLLMLNNDQISQFNKDKSVGVFDIHVKLNFRIRFRLGFVISHKYRPEVKCDIKVPLSSSKNIETFTFTSNKCKVAIGRSRST
jgi:hypothetical protein